MLKPFPNVRSWKKKPQTTESSATGSYLGLSHANGLRSWGFLTNPSRTFKGGSAAQRSHAYTWVRNVCGRDERVGPLIIDLSRRGKEMQGYVSL